MMAKKGQGMIALSIYGIMLAVMIWITFTQLLGPATDATQTARTVQQLDCDNSSISDGTKASCVIVDFAVFGWAGAVIAVIISLVGLGLYHKKSDNA